MDFFDAYEKFMKPEDDAMEQALLEQSRQEENKLWDDGTDGNATPNKTPDNPATPPALTLSEEQMKTIIAGVIAGMKGGVQDGGDGEASAG